MKLSEAIREGSKLRPKAKTHYFSETGSCSLGAAVEANYKSEFTDYNPQDVVSVVVDRAVVSTLRKYPEIHNVVDSDVLEAVLNEPMKAALSYKHTTKFTLWNVITLLNDFSEQEFSREEIADVVEQIENRTLATV